MGLVHIPVNSRPKIRSSGFLSSLGLEDLSMVSRDGSISAGWKLDAPLAAVLWDRIARHDRGSRVGAITLEVMAEGCRAQRSL
jgi:hypothetical protein